MEPGMERVDVRAVKREELRDIGRVKINTALPCAERVKSFVEQIGNPYCYLDGGIVVGIGYADTDVSLEDRLRAYAASLG